MSKLDNLNKRVIPDPLTGGSQTVYTSQDGTFMMCIPDREIPINAKNPEIKITKMSDDGKTKTYSWEIIDPKLAVFDVDKIQGQMKSIGALEDIDHEIIEPKQITIKPD